MSILNLYKPVCASISSLSALFFTQVVSAAFISPLRTKQGMVVSANPDASQAGLEMLVKGGNAVDAAVATTFAISVVEPFAAGIGGGGFLLTHQAQTGKVEALDFRERAPIKASRNMYLDAQGKVRPNLSQNGYLAVATPGTVAGLYEVHRRYGKLPWRVVIEPAIKLARNGFIIPPVVTSRSITAYEERKKVVLDNPAARAIFIRNGDFYQPGEKLVQRDLAQTLTEISQNPQSFYTGRVAKAITADMAKKGGIITLQDFKAYKPIWRTPVCGNFRNNRVCSMPPPSSGGVHLLQMLNMIGDTNLKSLGWNNPDTLHLLAETMKIAYADRAKLLGDPDFVKVPVAQLISPAYAIQRRQQIDMQRAKPSSEVTNLTPTPLLIKERGSSLRDFQLNKYPKLSCGVGVPARPRLERARTPIPQYGELNFWKSLTQLHQAENFKFQNPFMSAGKSIHVRRKIHSLYDLPKGNPKSYESPETTHINVVDGQRNAVSLTFTINTGFGAGVVAAGTGILLNNEMDDFAVAPGVPNAFGLVGSEANSIQPRKTPLSSMTPTIVTENGKLKMTVGAPGGGTIITQVLQVILNVLDRNMDAGAVVSAPRIHHQWLPDELRVETFGLDTLTLQELRRRGHNVKEIAPWGNANIIIVRPDNTLESAADPRGNGAPSGL
jgi:gamma-glutamyltranspeptidase / glutathione hydrolase